MINNTPPQSPYHQFLRLVHKMRQAQKNDLKFKSRQTAATRETTEREVDKFLEAVGLQAAQVRQMQLPSAPAEKGQGT